MMDKTQTLTHVARCFLALFAGMFLIHSCAPMPQSPPSFAQHPPAVTHSKPTIQTPRKPDAVSFLQLPLAEAQRLAEQHRIPHRVVKRDGQSLPVTKDYRPSRVNFIVNDGIVTGAKFG